MPKTLLTAQPHRKKVVCSFRIQFLCDREGEKGEGADLKHRGGLRGERGENGQLFKDFARLQNIIPWAGKSECLVSKTK